MKFLQVVHGDRVEQIIGRDNAEADAVIEALVVRRVGFGSMPQAEAGRVAGGAQR